MAIVLKPGTQLQNYKIIELVGDGTQSNIYLAAGALHLVWLIQIEAPDWEPNVGPVHADYFEIEGNHWVALETSGTSVVHLASWVDRLELPFIGWRWAKLAREIGYIHQKREVIQRSQSLALDHLVFNSDGELIVAQRERSPNEPYGFPAPEPRRELSAASDVFSLGSALNALVGDDIPRSVKSVLQRAMNPEPEKRYTDGIAFAEALAHVLPDPNREKKPRPPRKPTRLLALAGIGLVVCVVCALGIYLYVPRSLLDALPIGVTENPMQVTIVNWQLETGCIAHVEVRVQDGTQVLAASDVQFAAYTPLAPVTEIGIAPGTVSGESVLTLALGDYCKAGGALTVQARHGARQGNSVVYYNPGTP